MENSIAIYLFPGIYALLITTGFFVSLLYFHAYFKTKKSLSLLSIAILFFVIGGYGIGRFFWGYYLYTNQVSLGMSPWLILGMELILLLACLGFLYATFKTNDNLKEKVINGIYK